MWCARKVRWGNAAYCRLVYEKCINRPSRRQQANRLPQSSCHIMSCVVFPSQLLCRPHLQDELCELSAAEWVLTSLSLQAKRKMALACIYKVLNTRQQYGEQVSFRGFTSPDVKHREQRPERMQGVIGCTMVANNCMCMGHGRRQHNFPHISVDFTS